MIAASQNNFKHPNAQRPTQVCTQHLQTRLAAVGGTLPGLADAASGVRAFRWAPIMFARF
jgi:hypothetical protein